VLFSQPASAQSVICQDTSGTLPGLIEGAILLIVGVGVMTAVVVYFADTLLQMLTIDPPDRGLIKTHKRTVYKSTALLVIAGPLLTVMGPTLGLPFAECVDLIPF
jgi:undecaprenyl pyrophosphate phosphatase UppP